MSFEQFHPAVQRWFTGTFTSPTDVQRQAWTAIKQGRHTLVAAPTGSGKTLAAFLAAIDNLVHKGVKCGLEDETHILYVSPLKALSNDIQKNLDGPLQGIANLLSENNAAQFTLQSPPAHSQQVRNTHPFTIRAQVRTGDTPQSERAKMIKSPPHILVTTPESLFILLTSESGRAMLSTVRSVIVDEIHALTNNKRGAHLCLSLERLQALVEQNHQQKLVRIGLSATQKPIDVVAKYLVGNRDESCTIIDSGYSRQRDLGIEVTASPLQAVMSNEVWQEVYQRLTELIEQHRTTLIFVNNRRLAERAARLLSERVGADLVTAHHGSLAREHRLDAEQRLKNGRLRALVATASLELGIDIGEVDLVCQIGSPRSIAAFLQRVGRSGHSVDAIPKGRLFPTSRDDLVECIALLDAVQQGELDTLQIPAGPIDVLAQQLVGEIAGREWSETALFDLARAAYPYQNLSQQQFNDVLTMLADGYTTRRGRRSAYIYHDLVNHQLRARKGARLTAITNAGAIPDQFDYDVIMEPDSQFVGTVNEEFAFESLAGDIFQLGNTSYRILRIERGVVRVADAQGLPPNIPFWFGEAPGRSDELSYAVARLREQCAARITNKGIDATVDDLAQQLQLKKYCAAQLVEYLAGAQAALQYLPTQQRIIIERFFDEAGDQHIVIHSPFGSRINRGWGLALRKKFCRKFNFELQAAALDDSIVISLGATHSFPLQEIKSYLHSSTVRQVVTQAMLQAPLFINRWRWVASIALALKRNRGGKRIPAQFQRMDAEDLVAVIFPDQIACQDNVVGEREIPDHPLVNQTVNDCLNEAMDIAGLEKILAELEAGRIEFTFCDLNGPSPLAQEILTARPYAFLDDAPLEERRTQAVAARNFADPNDAAQLAKLDQHAIEQVRLEAWPNISNPDELHDAMLIAGFLIQSECKNTPHTQATEWPRYLQRLSDDKRATVLQVARQSYWVAAEKLPLCLAVWPQAKLQPPIQAVGPIAQTKWTLEDATRELLRGRLECLGPVTESSLARQMQLQPQAIKQALLALQGEGYAMQGQYSNHLDPDDIEWCERGLLARIHRYTMQKLRDAIKPVSAADYMRFLFEWHGIGDDRAAGEETLLNTLNQLEGFSIAASSWESDILPARISRYTNSDIDKLCASGHYLWARLGASGGKRQGPVKTTPITLLSRSRSREWFGVYTKNQEAPTLSSSAEHIFSLLQNHGASFYFDLVQSSGMLRTQVHEALAELAAAGIVTSDNFAGLRALIAPTDKKPRYARLLKRGMLANSLDHAGRWSILDTQTDKQPDISWFSLPSATLETIAYVLLQRYGVVFRKVLTRESQLPPWRELLYVYRRMEARGDIRGGRFVDGFGGEQYALPEAVGLLRKKRDDKVDLNVIAATDPLNLSGIILPGERIAAQAKTRIVFRNGIPVIVQLGKELKFLTDLPAEEQWAARTTLAKRLNPSNYRSPPLTRQ